MFRRLPLPRTILTAILAFSHYGCATNGAQTSSGEAITNPLASLEKGEIRLTCDTACSGSWGSTRRTAKEFFDAHLWSDLAITVARIGFRVDQAYFYLGRSAEGLGHRTAAQNYYRLALASAYKCDGFINNCDGLDVPKEAKLGLQRLTEEKALTSASSGGATGSSASNVTGSSTVPSTEQPVSGASSNYVQQATAVKPIEPKSFMTDASAKAQTQAQSSGIPLSSPEPQATKNPTPQATNSTAPLTPAPALVTASVVIDNSARSHLATAKIPLLIPKSLPAMNLGTTNIYVVNATADHKRINEARNPYYTFDLAVNPDCQDDRCIIGTVIAQHQPEAEYIHREGVEATQLANGYVGFFWQGGTQRHPLTDSLNFDYKGYSYNFSLFNRSSTSKVRESLIYMANSAISQEPQGKPKRGSTANANPPLKAHAPEETKQSKLDLIEAEGTRDGRRYASDLKKIGDYADETACKLGMIVEDKARPHYTKEEILAYARAFGNACLGRKVF